MNKLIITGRFTRDPELRYTNSGKAVTTFTIAVDRQHKKDVNPNTQTADFIRCTAWEKRAETICNSFKKGKPILVEGPMQSRNYDAPDGSKRTSSELRVDRFEFMEPKAKSQSTTAATTSAPAQAAAAGTSSFGPAVPDEEIPF